MRFKKSLVNNSGDFLYLFLCDERLKWGVRPIGLFVMFELR